jgi:hypothetical protein
VRGTMREVQARDYIAFSSISGTLRVLKIKSGILLLMSDVIRRVFIHLAV